MPPGPGSSASWSNLKAESSVEVGSSNTWEGAGRVERGGSSLTVAASRGEGWALGSNVELCSVAGGACGL